MTKNSYYSKGVSFIMSIKEQFINLCRQACIVEMLEEDSREVEPIMIDILNLVKTNPDSRALFINLFIEVADGKYDAPPFLLPFCMRELRFIEIKDHLIQQLNDKQNTPYIARKMNLISDVMHAFDDEVWKDADFWPYYAREMN